MSTRALARNLIIFLLVITWIIPSPVSAAATVQVIDTQVDYTYGETIIFRATLQSDTPIDKVVVFVRAEGQIEAATNPVAVDASGKLRTEFDISQHPLRGFSEVTYWYRVTLQNGETFTSQDFTFIYEDNRYDWETLESGDFIVHWYNGDVAFGQKIANVAAAGLQRAQTYLPLIPTGPINIYAYDSAKEMRDSLQISGQEWVAGHTDPDLGIILVSLPPGPEQQLEMERQIPHELMHVLVYQAIGPDYEHLPVWLNEGLATMTELYANPDYYTLLQEAYEGGDLLPMSSLCEFFPQDSYDTLLAYAQSASFTRYLYNQDGMPGLESLVEEKISGVDCERGVELALGSTLTQLETQWRRETFNEDALITSIENLLPWVLVLIFIVGLPLLFALWPTRQKRDRY